MKTSTVVAMIFGPLFVGALVPMVVPKFAAAVRGATGESMVCDTVDFAAKKGFLTADSAKRLYEEAVKAPGLDTKTRAAFESARKDCPFKKS